MIVQQVLGVSVLVCAGRWIVCEVSSMPQEIRRTIYVALLDEGTTVWRPVDAIEKDADVYQIVSRNPAPDDEKWEFLTGDLVRCVEMSFSGGATGF